jgi:glycosyl transferase family 25
MGGTGVGLLRAHVINLDRSAERMERMHALLSAMEITYERVSAVDGATLTQQFINEKVNVAPSEIHPSSAELGCFLSHQIAWERIASSNDDYGLVLEDDVVFARNFTMLLMDPRLFEGHPDIIRLEGWSEKVRISTGGATLTDGYKLHRLTWDTSGTCGYIVSRTGAARLLKLSIHYTAPIDHLLFRTSGEAFRTFDIRVAVPAACFQYLSYHGSAVGPLVSTISSTRPSTHRKRHIKKNTYAKIKREIVRILRQIKNWPNKLRSRRISLHPCGPLCVPGVD